MLFALAVLAVAVPIAKRRTDARPSDRTTMAAPEAPAPTPVAVAPPSPPEPIVDAGHEVAADAASTREASAAQLAWPEGVKTVLHVGDSLLGYEQGLALELRTRFEAAGIRYQGETYNNAGLHSFATSKTLEQLVRERKPDVVLVTLGMNNLTTVKPAEYERDVRSIVEQVGARPCFWIGPLAINRPENGLLAMLARSTAPCRWTSSYELDIERQPDAIHPTQHGAAKWADEIWTAIGAPRRSTAPRRDE